MQQRKYVRALDVSIAYQEWGNKFGDMVIAIPGYNNSSEIYRLIGENIEKNNSKIYLISLDLPGWKGYTKNNEIYNNINKLSELIEIFISNFINKNQKINITGYSYSAILIQNIIQRNRININKIILISPLNSISLSGVSLSKKIWLIVVYLCLKFNYFPSFLKTIEKFNRNKYIGRRSNEYYGHDSRRKISSEVNNVNLKTIFNVIKEVYNKKYNFSSFSKYKVLTIYAENDYNTVLETVKEIKAITDSQIYCFDKSDHYVVCSKANIISLKIANFIEH